MDFYKIKIQANKQTYEIFPDFIVGRSQDLMIRGHSFYAVWDDEIGLWSTDEYNVQRLVDRDLAEAAEQFKKDYGTNPSVKWLRSFGSNSWTNFRKLVSSVSDNSQPLDSKLIFNNTIVKKKDYASRRLPYSLEPGDHSAWDELLDMLYSPEERSKIEWVIGAIVSGDSKKIQKFLVFYGAAGTGKSTVLGIIQKLFEGYTTTFEAKALGSSTSSFATEVFKTNPLVAIQHDGDLSKIDDNTHLNSIISHEDMTMNEKYKSSYTAHVNAFLLMGTNKPVKISDAKSGIIRRLIDVNPTGKTFGHNHYNRLLAQIDFELGAIAHHCLGVYQTMGRHFYDGYRPVEMMFQTDPFFNFIEANYDIFKSQDGCTLKQAYMLYKEYCDDSGIKAFPRYKIREELRNYFDEYHTRIQIDGKDHRSYYQGFVLDKFNKPVTDETPSLDLNDTQSILDDSLAEMPAQIAKDDGTPSKRWVDVNTTLADINTTDVHYVKVPSNHIVIDFDIRDETGEKSLELNLMAAAAWPITYAELSKSGSGVHLHYDYTGDVEDLAKEHSPGIEIKVYRGNSALRRKLTRCNRISVATIKDGLILKERKIVADVTTMSNERSLRNLIARNLRKEIHPGTKPSIDFIKKILDDAYSSKMPYDITDLRSTIVSFANNSSNQPLACLKVVQTMRFKGEESRQEDGEKLESRIVFFDVEVYKNLFVVCWKYLGDDKVIRMINPTPQEVEELFAFRLVGFNNRRYDNHILWARFMGYTNLALFKLSQKMIVDKDRNAPFGEAYSLSYTDIYDFSSKKQSLKLFEIELGLPHIEIDIPWDQEVPEDQWLRVGDYCANDVLATEAVFNARAEDFIAREILAELSGLTVNDTTQKHTARIIFGTEKNPQKEFVYTDLSTIFPGYVYDYGKSSYRDENPGEGGYVYSEPGIYKNVALLDVASMHPTSIAELNVFGPYTENFSALKRARLAIKHKEYDQARQMLKGALRPYLDDETKAKGLSDALKIVINIVYGLTSAKFDNPFKDIRNKDNIVAKRGALFMIDLKHAVQEQGFTVAHIKTDSIKIPEATPEIIEFVMDFGKRYGYEFEHEETYEKFCLVNDAVYIASTRDGNARHWTTVGAQFAHPYVYKSLFEGEEITFDDLCETKSVTQGAMYLDFETTKKPMALSDDSMHFIGRTGRFIPVLSGGGILWRCKDDKRYAVSGTKGYLWLEATVANDMGPLCEIDLSYHDNLLNEARKTIGRFGDVDRFIKG